MSEFKYQKILDALLGKLIKRFVTPKLIGNSTIYLPEELRGFDEEVFSLLDSNPELFTVLQEEYVDWFEDEKKKLLKANQARLAKEKETQKQTFLKKLEQQANQTRKMMEKAKQQFTRQLTAETNRILKEQRQKQKEQQQLLKMKLEKASKAELSKAQKKLQREKKLLERDRRLQKDRNEKLVKQYKSFEAKKEKQLGSAQKKIALLEEQVRKGQTPQMLGLLEEKIFLAELKKAFPDDRFEHTGKGGRICKAKRAPTGQTILHGCRICMGQYQGDKRY